MTRPRLLTAPGWTKAGCRDLVVQYQGGRPTSARLLGFLCGTQPTGTDVGNAKARGACEALQNKDDRQVAVTGDVEGDTHSRSPISGHSTARDKMAGGGTDA